jgi:acyl-CoA reductase-like NAD-dependent aldehyde dehydrogenase
MGLNSASAGRFAFTQHEPIGVVVAVSAFNHPLNLIVHQVGPAIAAGCPVIVKPATDTPLSCLRFVELLYAAGLPQEWCQALVIETKELSQQLVTDPRVGFFSFIGSAAVGWKLRAQLAPGVRCALEHGGAAPVIVAADADLAQAVPALAKGGFYHAGQVCVSVQRVFAHRSIVAELAAELARHAGRLRVGDPLLAETEVGPLIRPKGARAHPCLGRGSCRPGCTAALRGGGAVGDLLRANGAAGAAARLPRVDRRGVRPGRVRLQL